MSYMSRHQSLALVLAGAVLLAVGLVAALSLTDSPGTTDTLPPGVALRVDGIDVTFAELEIGWQLTLAREEVEARLLAGDRLGFEEPMYGSYVELFTMTAESRERWPDEVRMVVGGVNTAAIYAEAVRQGVEPTDEEIASWISTMIAMEERIRESTEPGRPTGQRCSRHSVRGSMSSRIVRKSYPGPAVRVPLSATCCRRWDWRRRIRRY